MMTALQMIDALGGSAKAARRLGIPLTTVDSWKRKNAIPHWRLPSVEAAIRAAAAESAAEAAPAPTRPVVASGEGFAV